MWTLKKKVSICEKLAVSWTGVKLKKYPTQNQSQSLILWTDQSPHANTFFCVRIWTFNTPHTCIIRTIKVILFILIHRFSFFTRRSCFGNGGVCITLFGGILIFKRLQSNNILCERLQLDFFIFIFGVPYFFFGFRDFTVG